MERSYPCLAALRPPSASLLLGLVHGPLVVGEHGVYEVHVGTHALLGEGLRGLPLALLLVGQLLGRDGAVGDHPVRIPYRVGELLGRLVDLLLLLLIHVFYTPFSAFEAKFSTLYTTSLNPKRRVQRLGKERSFVSKCPSHLTSMPARSRPFL